MRPGMQSLLHLLRGNAADAVGLPQWQLVLALAEEQRVLPFLAGKLLQHPDLLPPEIKTLLMEASRETAHYAFLQSSELKHLLRAFAAAKIPVLSLKGPSLAQRLYGAASLRISSDLDLLVHKTDFATSARLLQALDFLPDAMPDDYHQKWSCGTTIVELHFDVENPLAIDFDLESAWRNAQLQHFAGQPAWRFAPSDELFYLCLHAVRHRFDRLSLILDISLALGHCGPESTRNPSRRKRAVDDSAQLLTLGRAMSLKLFPEASPQQVLPRTPAVERRTCRLAARFWSDLLTQPPAPQDWASMHRFYLELEVNPLRKLRRRVLHLRILLTRLIDDDFRFAARFGLHRTWQVRLLRPLRLVLRQRRS